MEAAKATYTKITGNTDNTMLNTIEQAVELLRMTLHAAAGVQDYQLREAIEAFLARYDGTNGKDGE